jgi:hypothetical protein
MQTLQTYGKWQLNKYSQLKYFKNGRANMHVAITYCIEQADVVDTETQVATGIFWIKTKTEALKEWREFKRTHCIGGAKLREEVIK